MDNFNMMGAVGYRVAHTDESQDYPIATIKLAFKMPEGENGRIEMFHIHEALRRLMDKKQISFDLTLPPQEKPEVSI
jgi:hypothetical protein|tara:strand:+ start:734 stop:964 length:231 start_codon:yes stop_codon:yes gene_type:complete